MILNSISKFLLEGTQLNTQHSTLQMTLSILAKIIDLLFPRFCPTCGNRLAGGEESICMACNLHLPRTDTWENPYENEMAKMFWHRIPIEKAGALFYYEGHSFTSNILYQLKYGHRPEIAFDMGKILAQEGMQVDFFKDIDGIIPIPLAKNRLKQRGYNQSEEIAKGIANLTQLPIYSNIVRRTSFKESQTHKNRWQRLDNVNQAFELTAPLSLEGKHLLMIDDVCTTGATIISCCQALTHGISRNENEENTRKIKFSILTIGWAKGN